MNVLAFSRGTQQQVPCPLAKSFPMRVRMDIDRLQALRHRLIKMDNPEWAQLVTLRDMVSGEFATIGHLTSDTYYAVLDWKLRKQRNRTERHREGNTEDLIKELTGTFWRVRHPDDDKQLEIRLKVLMAIPGIGLGVASAILTLSAPDRFGIIDFRNWKVLYDEEKRVFTLTEYKRYLSNIRELALQLRSSVQEVDYLLWKEFERLGESAAPPDSL
jgi:hypothetical protein